MAYDKVRNLTYDRACKGCIYLGRAGMFGCCDYIFIKGKPRHCPPGNGCTAKKKRSAVDGKG